MLKPILFCLLMLSSTAFFGQNLNMTFTAAGASTKVDSVKATNLRTNLNVTLPGNDTLVLAYIAGIPNLSGAGHQGTVFPNPFSGKTTLVANVQIAQTVVLEIYNLAGQSIAKTVSPVQPGSHSFALSLSKTGIYMVSITTNRGTEGYKIICTTSTGAGNLIRYTGIKQENPAPSFKEMNFYTLPYAAGDIILYRCRGGIHTTIITDSPNASKNYEVTFVPCTDPDGKNYAVVKIGAQTWMAENLAWLPAVSKSSKGSDSLKYYYVSNYEDSLVPAAKNSPNYKLYGVLYNWPAAMNAVGKKAPATSAIKAVCPNGWHLPDDGEWKILEQNLGMSQTEADSINLRNSGEVGKKLKSSVNWFSDGNGSNASGFTALPGGYRNTHGGFLYLDKYALFWTTSQSDTLSWYRSLYFNDNGVSRFTTLPGQGFSVRCVKDAL